MQKNQNQSSETSVKTPRERWGGKKCICVHTETHTRPLLTVRLDDHKLNEDFQFNGPFHRCPLKELGDIDFFFYDFLEECCVLRNLIRWIYHGGLALLSLV